MTRYGDEIYALIGKKEEKTEKKKGSYISRIRIKLSWINALYTSYFRLITFQHTIRILWLLLWRNTGSENKQGLDTDRFTLAGSRTTDYRVIKFKKVVNCPGKSQLSERAVNYDNNPCKR